MPLRITRKLGQSVYVGLPRRKVKVTGNNWTAIKLDIDGQEVEMKPETSINVAGVKMQYKGLGEERATFSFDGPREIPVVREELVHAE